MTTAAIANPAMASWAALNERAMFAAGESVLINGANGVAGRLAIRNAKLLGAGRIVVTAREESAREELARLGADAFISLSAAPDGVVDEVEREVARGIDVVLDYLWGRPAECVVQAVMNGAKRSAPRRVRFVNIGSLAGMDMSLAAAALRSSRIELMGSGLGSVSEERLASSAAAAVMALGAHLDGIPIRGVAIESLPAHWHAETTARLVFTF
ncbi:MAG TPA: zinc-binding dehydrogenase [Burkholderiaceae bacterium]